MLEKIYLDFSKTCYKVTQDILGLEFVLLGITDIWWRLILCWGGGCLVHCLTFSNIHCLNSLVASSTPLPVVATKNVFRYCQMSLGGQNFPWLRINALVLMCFTVLPLSILFSFSVHTWWFIHLLYPFSVHGITMLPSCPGEQRSHLWPFLSFIISMLTSHHTFNPSSLIALSASVVLQPQDSR